MNWSAPASECGLAHALLGCRRIGETEVLRHASSQDRGSLGNPGHQLTPPGCVAVGEIDPADGDPAGGRFDEPEDE